MTENIHIKGLPELQKFLDAFPAKVEKNILRGALRAGMAVVRPFAQQRIHSVSGELAAGLKLGTRVRNGKAIAFVRTSGPHGFVARWVEYGTKAHFIEAGPGGVLQFPDGGVATGVLHPGALPHPFLRPALDSEAEAAVVAAAEHMKKRLTKEGLDTSDVTIEVET